MSILILKFIWLFLYTLNNNFSYFDNFGVGHIPWEVKKFIDKSTIVVNCSRIQAFGSIICLYFCIRLIEFVLKGTNLTDFIDLFSSSTFNKNDDINLDYFRKRY